MYEAEREALGNSFREVKAVLHWAGLLAALATDWHEWRLRRLSC
jgi:hypothetical protein